MEPEKIAVFDFDGTITARDSLMEFLKFTHGYLRTLWGLFILSPVLILYKLRIIPNYTAKQLLFSWFYRGWSIKKFDVKCSNFIDNIHQMVRPEAMEAIQRYQAEGIKVVVITASPENWVRPWADAVNLHEVIGTKLAVDSNGRLTGRFLSKNCYGPEKVNRFLERYPNRLAYILEAYGDSEGDAELLAFADKGYLKRFS
jgi:HAD superfamily hydrolase (TIGR01490 family)